MKLTKESLAKRLKQWRARRKLTQEDAARHLGVSQRSFENWEQGRSTPSSLGLSMLLERIK